MNSSTAHSLPRMRIPERDPSRVGRKGPEKKAGPEGRREERKNLEEEISRESQGERDPGRMKNETHPQGTQKSRNPGRENPERNPGRMVPGEAGTECPGLTEFSQGNAQVGRAPGEFVSGPIS